MVTTSNQNNTALRYFNAASAAFEYAMTASSGSGKSQSDQGFILAQDGINGWKLEDNSTPSPNPSYPPIYGKFEVAADLEKVSNLPEFKSSSSTLMLFVGHGGRGNSIDPGKSEVSGWGTGRKPTFDQLKEQIQKIATNHPVRIVCLTCYSGNGTYLS